MENAESSLIVSSRIVELLSVNNNIKVIFDQIFRETLLSKGIVCTLFAYPSVISKNLMATEPISFAYSQ